MGSFVYFLISLIETLSGIFKKMRLDWISLTGMLEN